MPGVAGAPPSAPGGASGSNAQADAAKDEDGDVDEAEDARARLDEDPSFHPEDATANVVPSDAGGILMSLREGGLRYLAAGARASVGARSGRYMFEVRVLEDIGEASAASSRGFARVGVAREGATSILGNSEDSICFTSDGQLMHAGQRSRLTTEGFSARSWSAATLAVVLNLDAGSPGANTISLFVNGERFAKAQPLPQGLRGAALYPAVAFKGTSLHVNFGPTPHVALPFACRMLRDAAKDDVVVRKRAASGDDAREVVFPVCLPDEGGFDWLDGFLAEHPGHLELSERRIAAWAAESGVPRAAAKGNATERSNDRACVGFGVPALEDGSAQRALRRFAELSQRNLVVMEVQGNLDRETRAEALGRFPAPRWRRVAVVAVGEPDAAFKARSREAILREKQEALDAAHAQKQAERKRKAQAEAAQGPAAKKAKGQPGAKATPEAEAAGTEAQPEEPPPKAELDAGERRAWFRKVGGRPDVAHGRLAASIGRFALPDAGEGFDEVRYVWSPAEKAQERLKEWMVERKRKMPLEHLTLSDWFKRKLDVFRKDLARWQAAQKAAQAARLKPAAKKDAAEGGAAEDTENADSNIMLKEATEYQRQDVFGVDDICDAGSKVPLFIDFDLRDWAMVALRFELHLMVHSLQRDSPDPDRKRMTIHQVQLYYNKYYKKALSVKGYGFDTIDLLVRFLEDVVYVDRDTEMVEPQVDEDHATNDIFVKLTEERRRHVLRQTLAGDADVLRPSFPALLPGAATVTKPVASVGVLPLLAPAKAAAPKAAAPKAAAPKAAAAFVRPGKVTVG